MEARGNIIICDESALFFHVHSDSSGSKGLLSNAGGLKRQSPLESCVSSSAELSSFNTRHPLYGGEPVSVLVNHLDARRSSDCISAKLCSYDLPATAFTKLRDGLFVTSPELTFARLAYGRPLAQVAQVGIDLCARYYIHLMAGTGEGEIRARSRYATTPERLLSFLNSIPSMRGANKAKRALAWVIANSGSPMETVMRLQYCLPLWNGGLALPFNAMNYDVRAGRLARITEQGEFCIDMVNTDKHVGVEYDGDLYHQDASKDKRRRNALAALGWEVFAIDKAVLFDAEATEKSAFQIARRLGVRIQKPRSWEQRFVQLRHDLGLPA